MSWPDNKSNHHKADAIDSNTIVTKKKILCNNMVSEHVMTKSSVMTKFPSLLTMVAHYGQHQSHYYYIFF